MKLFAFALITSLMIATPALAFDATGENTAVRSGTGLNPTQPSFQQLERMRQFNQWQQEQKHHNKFQSDVEGRYYEEWDAEDTPATSDL